MCLNCIYCSKCHAELYGGEVQNENEDSETGEICPCGDVERFYDGDPNDCEKCRMTPFNKWIENRGVKN